MPVFIKIVTSLNMPKQLAYLFSLIGIRILSRTSYDNEAWEKYSAVPLSQWAKKQKYFRDKLLSMSTAKGSLPNALHALSVSKEFYFKAALQALNAEYLYGYSFVSVTQAGIPKIQAALHFPPILHDALESNREGTYRLKWLSQILWCAVRATNTLKGLLLCGAHGVLLIRDELFPIRLIKKGAMLCPQVFRAHLSNTDKGLNIASFIVSRSEIFQHRSDIVIGTPQPFLFESDRVLATNDLRRLRLRRHPSMRAIWRGLIEQVRIAGSILFGDWRTVNLVKDLAALPRYHAMIADVVPVEVLITISSALQLPLWLNIAQNYGAQITMACYSTQVKEVQEKTDFVPNVITGIYMLLNSDRYLVWDQQHRSDLLKVGVPEKSIEIVGPVIFSKTYVRPAKNLMDEIIRIDYFDQTPPSRADLLYLGKPYMFFSHSRSVAALNMVVEASKLAFAGRPYEVRLKAKRTRGTQYLGPYSNRIGELSTGSKNPILKIVKPETSPLYMHSTASLTICFPFVSTGISSQASGVPACFCNPEGDVMIEEGQAHGLPVFESADDLAQWMRSSLQFDEGTDIAS